MDVRVAAYGVIIEDGQMLLAHWNQNGRHAWTLPGGGLEPGEHPADAAVREIREETGYKAVLEETLGVDSGVIPAHARFSSPKRGPMQAIRIIYRARIVAGTLRYEQNGSTDWAAWHACEAVPDLNHVSTVGTALRMLRENSVR